MKSKEIYQYALGALVVIVFFAILFAVIQRAIPDGNKEIAYLVVGALVAKFGDVVNYFYGSSKGSSDKNEMLKKNEV